MNTAVHGFMLTPVVNRPQDKVMVNVSSGFLPMAVFTIAKRLHFPRLHHRYRQH